MTAMGTASVIHNGVHIHLKLNSRRPRLSLPYPSPNWSRPHFFHHHIVSVRTGGQSAPIARSRAIEQDDDLSTSEEKRGDSTPRDGISKVESSPDEAPKKIKGPETYAASVRTVALWVFAAVAFGIGVGFKEGVDKATEFFAGYLLEQSLLVDNLFVFVLVFKYFKVPLMYQNRVLSYGIAGAVVFRLTLILLGTATLQKFEVVNLFLAAILLYSSFKLFSSGEDDTDLSNNFIVKTCQRFIPVTSNYGGNRFFTFQDGVRKATPLLLTVAVIELSDIAFAVDSIPAVFCVTRDPFIVFSSNLFAIVGLRSLYTLISQGMSDLEYLQPSIAVVLGFIGCKMILDFFGFHVSTEVSLGLVATGLSAGVLLSLMKKSD
ncbi:thylakoid membrane protein TERC, chloroplastic-like isoform X1 [Pyrus x bretschneideri]|uniref:thylakoid membrane protein TERC, chloroplastic-like isoform X1 n=1 Tax=Pyrus x bretschneideri TaxID=225117 RepID=UPI00202DDB37|nr:thylakoid membrane protein TERC, chloroplastic-like isoform X1 [Pyrus x bretschneideri]XP_048423626.1 thylakoid membrane protein TERC, chloroplastic-like isoform X1 [Pyrus x bretschneideri]XP_048423627.1 thylakoid membrane protein TERC, chloroplastic-like isoform X1 [Pyrus x bretschneideri]XP_048423628.1 thylakoid membrane protein TERC, chloroplastic-like isoform X1 [Pyrus x bretschneideri]XP_048423629.1 thylakoid membrane protein TERC, chloroplastic-like isoform X1 [Pyrus x bretschneideri]